MSEAPIPAFTVFTPTYNRADVLPRVYDSLHRQTLRDFEWLVVDDGSTDGTAELIARWAAEADFPIRYVRRPHSGFPATFNHGVAEARGTLFLSLDSDDTCLPDALERLKHHWDAIPADQVGRFVGVTGLCVDVAGAVVGDAFPADVVDSDFLEMMLRYRVTGEKWGFQRRDVMTRFPFPERAIETWGQIGSIWSAISRAGYKTRYVNEPLRTYHTDRADAMSKDRAEVIASSQRLYFRDILNHDLRWFGAAPGVYVLAAVRYARFAFHERFGIVRQWRELTSPGGRALWSVGVPAGYLLFRRDRW